MRLLLLISLILTLTQAEPRKALLIGNSKYTHIPNLDNPAKPIGDLKEALVRLGFDVVVKYNLNSENLSAEVEKFADRLTSSSTGFFYYSGHGSQLKGVSYLIPTNVDTKKANKVRYYALSIDEVLTNLKSAKNRVNMLFFDACRDVPTGTRGGTRGLGIPINKPNGSLIVYSTEAGQVAGDNSIFISELTKVIQEPNKKIWEIGNQLSNTVATITKDKQIPEMYSKRLPNGFVLNSGVQNSNNENCTTGDECYRLGYNYHIGRGVKKDYKKAVKFYKKACELKSGSGCNELGTRYYYGQGVTKDFTKAVKFYKKACDLKSGSGCNNLGTRYYYGQGVKKDLKRAKEVYKKACDLGYTEACIYSLILIEERAYYA